MGCFLRISQITIAPYIISLSIIPLSLAFSDHVSASKFTGIEEGASGAKFRYVAPGSHLGLLDQLGNAQLAAQGLYQQCLILVRKLNIQLAESCESACFECGTNVTTKKELIKLIDSCPNLAIINWVNIQNYNSLLLEGSRGSQVTRKLEFYQSYFKCQNLILNYFNERAKDLRVYDEFQKLTRCCDVDGQNIRFLEGPHGAVPILDSKTCSHNGRFRVWTQASSRGRLSEFVSDLFRRVWIFFVG